MRTERTMMETRDTRQGGMREEDMGAHIPSWAVAELG